MNPLKHKSNMKDGRSPASLHSNFFSSLKQVEKRLKFENPEKKSSISPSPLLQSNKLLTEEESLSSPLHLHFDQSNNNNNQSLNALQESGEPPEAFLSCSLLFPPTQQNPPQTNALHQPETINDTENYAIGDIGELIELLGLSNCEGGEEERGDCCGGGSGIGGGSCRCQGGFYEKIVGVKGPKCGKEVERLEGWIKCFMNGGGEGSIEPFRLAHLLLGKAAFVSDGADHGFGGLEFPSTVGDFLLKDPPPTD
ncbi:hypothetical protein COP1_036535 [Malus domestica]